MPMAWPGHLRLLIWKNFKLQWRRPKGTAAEILMPTLFVLMLVGIRTLVSDAEEKPAEAFCSIQVLGSDYKRRMSQEQVSLVGNGLGADEVRGCNSVMPDEDSFFTSAFENCSTSSTESGVCGYTAIAFVPDTAHVREVMQHVDSLIRPGLSFESRDAQIDYIGLDNTSALNSIASSTNPKFLLALVFEQLNADGSYNGLWIDEMNQACPSISGFDCAPRIHTQLRFPENFGGGGDSDYEGWETERTFPEWDEAGPDLFGPYNSGREFWMYEAAVQRALAMFFHPESREPEGVPRIKPMPYPAYTATIFVRIVKTFLGTFLVLTYLYTALSITRGLVEEKQARLKEAMMMMGLTSWVHWAAWFIKYFLFMMISVVLVSALLVFGQVFENSDFTVILLLLTLYAMSTITFCFFVSTFFDSANTAAAAGGLLYFLAYVPSYFAEQLSASDRTAACLLGPSCLGFGIEVLARHEVAGRGLQWSNLSSPADELDPFTMSTVIGMLFVDTVLYFILAWYIEKIHPGQYGIPMPLLFPLYPSFWFGPSRHRGPTTVATSGYEKSASADHEAPPEGLRPGVEIRNLRKVFHVHGQDKVAVDDLSLSLYEDQVTVLLGHNGAGKTTTMSVMVGLYAPTSGSVTIGGHDVTTERSAARQSLGLCPQFDILFATLTVEENLQFFGRLKGLSGEELHSQVDSYIKDMDLEPKRRSASKTLSGGQKRALSVGIAFIGDSEVVILDEPTSGMDPQKRRHTWDVIINYKKGRTILLTTHFLDEADLLGDRIAILSEGRLSCSGRSDFLKTRFGVGYHLTMVKGAVCDTEAVLTHLSESVQGIILEDDLGAEITCLIPKVPLNDLGKLVGGLEENQNALGIDSFGVQVTTLEEVFLNIGKGSSVTLQERNETIKSHRNSISAAPATEKEEGAMPMLGWRNTPSGAAAMSDGGATLRFRQFRALFTKRVLHSRRHLRNVIPQILLPVLFAFAALAVARLIDKPYETAPCRRLDLDTSKAAYMYSGQDFAGDYRTDAAPYVNASLSEIGRRPPTASVVTLVTATTEQVGVSQNVTARNMTDHILGKAKDFLTNGFYQENFGASSYEQGVFNLTAFPDVCGLQRGGNMDFGATLTLRTDTIHYFHLSNGDTTGGELQLCITTGISDSCGATISGFSQNGNYYSWVTEGLTASSTFFYRCNDSQTNDNSPIVFTTDSAAVSEPSTYTALAWYNTEAIHASAESLAFAGQTVARQLLQGEALLPVSNCPLPQDAASTLTNLRQDVTGFQIAVFMLFAFAFLVASFVVFPVEERVSLAKHVQFVSGVTSNLYWLSNLAWDYINFTISNACVIIVFAAFGTRAYTGNDIWTVIMLLQAFAFAVLPFVYLLSRQFHASSSAYAKLCVGFVFLTFAPLLALMVLRLPALGYADESRIMKYAFFTNPVFAVCIGLYDMYTNDLFYDFCSRDETTIQECEGQNIRPEESSLSWNDHPYGGVLRNIVALVCLGFIYLCLLLFLESGGWAARSARSSRSRVAPKTHRNEDEDDDVAAEREAVLSGSRAHDPVVVSNLTKVYSGKKAAVNNLCFSVRKGECFGLLGVNGAGKTSTFRMLTGESFATAGNVHILGLELMHNISEIRRNCGYCPQFGGILSTLTGREHLRLFARLRGVQESFVEEVVSTMLTNLNLDNHADRPAGTYSGGNKRKLSTAIALTGDPQIVFLDEPTTGMDPGARRHLWNVVSRAVQAGRSIILTSHSMEECEALATNLAIMKDGQFKCIGSAQKLRSKFGEGFMLTMRCKKGNTKGTQDLKQFALGVFPNLVVVEEHDRTLSLQVPSGPTWTEMFAFLQRAVDMFDLEDHSLSQPSLESVFIRLVGDQNTDTAVHVNPPDELPKHIIPNPQPPEYADAPSYDVQSI